MKTSIMLVPTLGNTYTVEMKQAITNYLGIMNVKPEEIENDYKIPVVTYNGILSCDDKQNLQNYMDSKFADACQGEPVAIFYIEYTKEPENASTLMFKEEYYNEKGY